MAHNFFIGDLGFHKVINDEHPYERATAPFRKEQFDAAPTVGDQSLAGWWTRGQLSFHMGGGVKYYEVLDGEEVLNRYDTSENLTTLHQPGEVTLDAEAGPPTTYTFGTGLTWAAGYESHSGNDGLAFIENGVLYSAQTPSSAGASVSMVDTTSPVIACSAPTAYSVFVATSGKSIERHLSDSGTAQLYTHSQDIEAVFYEKGRIWMIDAGGDLYALAPTPTATPTVVDSGDLVGNIQGAGAWSMTAGPGAVYVTGGGTEIHRVTIDDSTAVPTLGAPTVAATLPQFEYVSSLTAHLGHLVIGTSRGIRVAAISSDGGLLYGPLHEVGRCGRTAVPWGTAVWFVAGGDPDGLVSAGGHFLCEIDLNRGLTDLTFAWTRHKDTGGWSTYRGAIAVNGRVGYFRGSGLGGVGNGAIETLGVQVGPLATTGGVVTGLHRMGTLDLKHFNSVTVRYAGTGGTVATYRVDPGGAETLLGSATVTGDGLKTFPMGLDGPVESVGLKFVLSRSAADTSVGPTLLGYQIKALPSPVRQRLIRVPLMMFDTERGPTGRAIGAEKSAWTRYAALEDLEENDALITYEDKDTGETGTAFIESVELIQRNGSKGVSRSNGFGGVVSVTLRKVS